MLRSCLLLGTWLQLLLTLRLLLLLLGLMLLLLVARLLLVSPLVGSLLGPWVLRVPRVSNPLCK